MRILQWGKARRRGEKLTRQYPFCLDCGDDMTGYSFHVVICASCSKLRREGRQNQPHAAFLRRKRELTSEKHDPWATAHKTFQECRIPEPGKESQALQTLAQAIKRLEEDIRKHETSQRILPGNAANKMDVKALKSLLMDMEEEADAIRKDLEEADAQRNENRKV